jgi:hypothetical protein
MVYHLMGEWPMGRYSGTIVWNAATFLYKPRPFADGSLELATSQGSVQKFFSVIFANYRIQR